MDVLTRNNVRLAGPAGAPPMMLAHGFGCDQGMWRYVVPQLAESFRVILFDHTGAGGSDASAFDVVRHGSLDGYAADVVEILDALELGPVTFVGHSVSAMIGVLAAIARPDLVDRLVLVGPSPRYVDDGEYRGGFSQAEIAELLETMDANYLGWSAVVAPVIMGAPDRPELAEELVTSFCGQDPAIARHFARTTFLSDNRADLPRLARPALVVQCRDDAIAPQAVGRYVAAHIPRSELVILDAVGHCPNLSAPDELVATMRRYLAG
ncbi:alpha/beta fold hydrolase [Georgenia faecalis]|uniref:alpha/beta fold hydrolase n=1 Tax=Georgenia faecalis TaxID=2483799 RepID=UPI000FD99306|nr:alpha/beta hydrolase [Georgenia faecalis]